MKGKIGLVVGLGAGYVLGTRAGRERYEQIKTQWLKIWNLDPVQAQVSKVTDFTKSQAAAVPAALWHGAVKVVRSVSGDATPGEKLDSVIASGKEAADEVADAAEDTADAAKKSSAAKKTGTRTARSNTARSQATGSKKPTQSGK